MNRSGASFEAIVQQHLAKRTGGTLVQSRLAQEAASSAKPPATTKSVARDFAQCQIEPILDGILHALRLLDMTCYAKRVAEEYGQLGEYGGTIFIGKGRLRIAARHSAQQIHLEISATYDPTGAVFSDISLPHAASRFHAEVAGQWCSARAELALQKLLDAMH